MQRGLVENLVPFDAIQQPIKVAFEDGASKMTKLHDSFIKEIVKETNALHERVEVKDKTMSNQCPLDQGRTFQPQLPTIALPARKNRRMQDSASPLSPSYLRGNRPIFFDAAPLLCVAVNFTPIGSRPTKERPKLSECENQRTEGHKTPWRPKRC
jgi:hypothetical protein